MSAIDNPCVPCPHCGTCLTQSAEVAVNSEAAIYDQDTAHCKFALLVKCSECEADFAAWMAVGALVQVNA